VPLLQLGAVAGHVLSFRHSTHFPWSPQYGVGAAQPVSAVHCTQRPSAVHTGVDVPAQSALVVHWVQRESAVLQCGAAAGHCASVVQPVRQTKSCGSQMGAAVPQSLFERHATQV
jgi:hypothetical protein